MSEDAIKTASAAVVQAVLNHHTPIDDYLGRLSFAHAARQIASLAEVTELLKAIEQSEHWRTELRLDDDAVPSDQAQFFTNTVVVPMLDAFVEETDGISYDAEAAEALFERLRAYVDIEDVPVFIATPLSGFSTPARIKVATGIEIIPFSEDAKLERLVAHLYRAFGGPIDWFEASTWQHAIRVDFTAPKTGSIDHYPAVARAQHVLTSLRLLKSSSVRTGPVVFAASAPAFVLPYMTSSAIFSGGARFAERWSQSEPYSLDAKSAAELPAIFQAVEAALAADGTYEFAVRRFDLGAERSRADDRLVDYWIALESLFAPDGSSGEVTFKASLRAARYVGDSPEERIGLHKKLKDSYGVRSKIVHGDEPKMHKLDEGLTVADTTLRSALRLWPRKPHTSDDFEKELLS